MKNARIYLTLSPPAGRISLPFLSSSSPSRLCANAPISTQDTGPEIEARKQLQRRTLHLLSNGSHDPFIPYRNHINKDSSGSCETKRTRHRCWSLTAGTLGCRPSCLRVGLHRRSVTDLGLLLSFGILSGLDWPSVGLV
jgi:hypothetical protein